MKKALLFLLVIITISVFAQDDIVAKNVAYPAGYKSKMDAVYSEMGDWKGHEDIYYNPTTEKPTPILFNIHGGGWNHGVKESQTGYGSFFKLGYAVANIEYRLTGQATAPAAIEDVRAAILYVVQHAKEFNIDPNYIVVMGGSAGGHLALMAGLLQNDHTFDGAYKNVTGYSIKAIIDKYGPTDLSMPEFGKYKSLVAWLGSQADNIKFRESVSPIFYVKKTSPPIFIVHGDADPVVPYQQSIILKDKLEKLGVKNVFLSMPGGGHGKFTPEQKIELSAAIITFLKGLNG